MCSLSCGGEVISEDANVSGKRFSRLEFRCRTMLVENVTCVCYKNMSSRVIATELIDSVDENNLKDFP
ncbi:hypothetical protein KOR42_15330 [Thalassoglobus neptunius]|uniref:Uncharacterized protein n=1 Tax=Thalassoglobus neptunius TaxID=1938619 RepID=A0A5C5X8G2_9PLAN|nr:hypothetical protein KOR42_15330 [Thalassoglobus neptunius]